jgi:D-tyrosyl-tRNA(Tyr) deacylase
MRAVIQRVSSATVKVNGTILGAIGPGLVVFLGIGQGDDPRGAETLAQKIADLRIFSDAQGRFNLSAQDVGAQMMVVSQFTLYADCRRGRRPSFARAASPEEAAPLVEYFVECLRGKGLTVATGRFQAAMSVEIHNEGPVTLVLDSELWRQSRRAPAAHWLHPGQPWASGKRPS